MNAGDGMIASIGLFGGDFAPRSYALCQGQILPINSNTALFSLIGTIYGGDGRTTFALPDLRGRVAMGSGNGPGLTPSRLGARGGNETTTLITNNLPSHNHAPKVQVANENGNAFAANGNGLAARALDVETNAAIEVYASSPTFGSLELGGVVSSNVGANSSFSNTQPYLVLNYIIALTGVFPSRS